MFKSDVILTESQLNSHLPNFSLISQHLTEQKGLKLGVQLQSLFENNQNLISIYHLQIENALRYMPPPGLSANSQFIGFVDDLPNTIYVCDKHYLTGTDNYFKVDVNIDSVGMLKWGSVEKMGDNLDGNLFANARKKKHHYENGGEFYIGTVPLNEKNGASASVGYNVNNGAGLDNPSRVLRAFKENKITGQQLSALNSLLSEKKPYRVGISSIALKSDEILTIAVNDSPEHIAIPKKVLAAAVVESRNRLPLPIMRDHRDGNNLENVIGGIHWVGFCEESGVVSLDAVELYDSQASNEIIEILSAGHVVGVSVKGTGFGGTTSKFQKSYNGYHPVSAVDTPNLSTINVKRWENFSIDGFDLVLNPAVKDANFRLL